MQITREEATRLHDHDVIGAGGEKVGSIEDFYVDDDTGNPEWLLLNRGLFGMMHSVVPLVGARRENGSLRVIFEKDAITDAPDVDADEDITEDDERRLYDYYADKLPDAERYDLSTVPRPTALTRSRTY